MSLKDLIAKQKATVEALASESLNVVLGGELVEVSVTQLRPDEWQALTAANPPRAGIDADRNLGFNQDHLPHDYPAERITVAGEAVDKETWSEIWGVLNSVNRANVGTLIWGINVYSAIVELRELGKAVAGQSSNLPANRESRRAVSKGGSPRK